MLTHKIMKPLLFLVPFLTPALVLAQRPTGTDKNFSTLVYSLGSFFQGILIIIIGLSFVVFLWGLARTLLHVGSPEKNAEAKTLLIWGTIGLLVSLSVIGILNLLENTAVSLY